MRKTIVAGLILWTGLLAVNAQSGEKWIGGGLTVRSTDYGNGNSASSFELSPEIGFRLSDKWSLGGALVYGKETDVYDNSTTSLGIVPFARLHIGEAGKFEFFGQGELPIMSYDEEENDFESSMVGFRIRPGIAFHFNDKFAAELLMPSLFSFASYGGDADGSEFNFLFNSGYSIQNYVLNPSIVFVYKF